MLEENQQQLKEQVVSYLFHLDHSRFLVTSQLTVLQRKPDKALRGGKSRRAFAAASVAVVAASSADTKKAEEIALGKRKREEDELVN